MKHLLPQEIEATSMSIIEKEAGNHEFSPDEWIIVKRIIHATADFDVMKTIHFHPAAIAAGIKAIREGHPIYLDTGMLAAAVHKSIKEKWGCHLVCFIADGDVRNQSAASGETRSVIAMRKAKPWLKSGIVAIGNAPTALSEAIRLSNAGEISPELVIGMPVGFVGALESKRSLIRSGLVHITMQGRKGGTPATAAAVNALIKLAGNRSHEG